ncbi:CbiX/SirB N-terminal domain-containing protein [Polyangium sorediatum]|uniref:CbiX/SirB N-terminal domain-containing protein n=1 Tax=Polyangium sorediatum TaxID=889274 RepID=A0ABT6P3A0_9BACT|nr:CbiX/SirB N-terminal domain-containing protein [Polyangium sorediatum]MDI1434720.1 CbiX/SirB N-terminal domain-containing protein [Polyangium sorediatum]
MESSIEQAVLLVGHGAAAKDCPRELVTRWKSLEGRRHATGGPPSAEEIELDQRIRAWPRTDTNDPYRKGLLSVAAALRPLVAPAALFVAYNEFCAPTIEDAADEAVAAGATTLTVVPSMLTPGGVHSEIEIPEALARIRARHPGVTVLYAWPYDLHAVAALLAAHARQFGEAAAPLKAGRPGRV